MSYDGQNMWLIGATAAGSFAWKVRAEDMTLLATIALGGAAWGSCFDGVNIWATSAADNSVTRIDCTTGAQATFATGQNPTGVCFDGASVWIAHHNGLTKLRAIDGMLETELAGIGGFQSDACFDGECVWVSSSGSSVVTKIRTSDNTILTQVHAFPVGGQPGLSSPLAYDGTYTWLGLPDENSSVPGHLFKL